MATKRLLSVMMPAYNEARTIEIILQHVLDRPEVGEVIAVDDGSTDGTWDILSRVAKEDSRVRPIRQPKNAGKGAPQLRLDRHEAVPPLGVTRDDEIHPTRA